MPKTTKPVDKKDEKTAVKKEAKKETPKKSLIAPNDFVTITLKWTILEPVYKKTVNRFAKDVKAEGFRKGKVPFAIVEQKVGLDKIIDQVLRELIPQAYEEQVKKDNKKPITTPEFNPISLEKGKDWVLEAHFSGIPEVKLGDYKKVTKKGKAEAAKFIEERNKQIKKEAAECKKEDKDHDHEHSHQELSEDEKKEINLQHIFKELVAEFSPAIGELLLRQETQNEYERLVKQLKQYKISIEDYLAKRQISIDQLSQELAGSVLSRLQLDFIMAEISKVEKFTATDEDIKAELNKITDKKMRQELEKNQDYLNQLKANLLQRKTLDLLLTL
ncbi:MAG: Trigger factor [Candidatus Pacebacteria bacterium GW2011_GWF2_38_9]|nr:MAG: tig, trigger factor, trigger factor [candidate division TM6 bacterium GW2011_GWF2_28_16]KKQ10095.1 MAG: Trigger factor [Candidatus Pacebacteria bacterium GW2011_GWF1_36_5]KKQ89051.1 MAG: Trigger factor [Candidatus Pacebacteria bacterium GW2011_GWF2_38_9]